MSRSPLISTIATHKSKSITIKRRTSIWASDRRSRERVGLHKPNLCRRLRLQVASPPNERWVHPIRYQKRWQGIYVCGHASDAIDHLKNAACTPVEEKKEPDKPRDVPGAPPMHRLRLQAARSPHKSVQAVNLHRRQGIHSPLPTSQPKKYSRNPRDAPGVSPPSLKNQTPPPENGLRPSGCLHGKTRK